MNVIINNESFYFRSITNAGARESQILLPISIKFPEAFSSSAKGFNEIIIYIIRFNCFAIINYYFSATILVAAF